MTDQLTNHPTPVRSCPRITLIVARARNGVIGCENRLPWHLPEDLAHFKRTTLGHPIVMGRKTFESIGRALPGRRNLVLTRDPRWRAEGCEPMGSMDEAMAAVAGLPELFVIGGADIYRQALPRADRLLITEVDLDVPGDAHFATPAAQQWELLERQPGQSAAGIAYEFRRYERRGDKPVTPSSS